MSTKVVETISLPERRDTDAPPADDRDPDEGPGKGSPSFGALVAMWAERDVNYARLPKYLTEKQIECIRLNRLAECNDLPAEDRGKAADLAFSWYPPEHGQ